MRDWKTKKQEFIRKISGSEKSGLYIYQFLLWFLTASSNPLRSLFGSRPAEPSTNASFLTGKLKEIEKLIRRHIDIIKWIKGMF